MLLVAVVLVTLMGTVAVPAWGMPTKQRSDDGVSASPPRPTRKSVSVVPVAVDGLTRALEGGRVTEAQYSLQRAASLFALQGVRARFGRVLPCGIWRFGFTNCPAPRGRGDSRFWRGPTLGLEPTRMDIPFRAR